MCQHCSSTAGEVQLLSLLIKHRDSAKSTKSNIRALWFLPNTYEQSSLISLFLPLSVGQFSNQSSRYSWKERLESSQRIPTQKVNVIVTVCTALSDLGPCCPSDPTSRYCPSLCLPSDWEEAPSCPSAHEACSPLYLAYSSSGGRPRAPSRQVSMQMSPTERLSPAFPYKKQQ